MNEDEISKLVVDASTGEVIDQMKIGDQILRGSSLKSYQTYTKQHSESGIYHKWDLDNFFRVNVSELVLLLPDLNQAEKSLLLSLSPYIGYETGALIHKNGVTVDKNTIVNLAGMSRNTVNKALDGLIDKKIIHNNEDGTGRDFYMNPWIFSKGPRINKELREMFADYPVRILGNIKWKDA